MTALIWSEPRAPAMPKSVFVSYCHRQGDWVWTRLVPCLRAGGSRVLADRERFAAGKSIVGQMDAEQDGADATLLVLSPDYMASPYCRHEMERAIARDPRFGDGAAIPLLRLGCDLPPALRPAVAVDLRDDRDAAAWSLLLHACGADLGTRAPAWLEARDAVWRFLERDQSVNLVVHRPGARWRGLIEHLREDFLPDLGCVDLEKPATASRRGLVHEILRACGSVTPVPPEPEDLVELDRVLSARPRSRLALVHFDLVAHRRGYGVDLFASLRYLLTESRKLVLLVQSRTPLAALLPRDHPLSPIDVKTVEI